MSDAFGTISKQSLSDRLAQRIRGMIHKGDYRLGDRLPAIMEMARSFGVGHPTVREALTKLETIGLVEIRHGSGVYVSRSEEVPVLASPDYSGPVTRKLLLDLIRSRTPLEMQSVADAVVNRTDAHLQEMRRLLNQAGENLHNDDILHAVNMAYHRQIAIASGNTVLVQLLDVLRALFPDEQRQVFNSAGAHGRDHQDHLVILEAMEKRDAAVGVERMRLHLEGVQETVRKWDPVEHPVSQGGRLAPARRGRHGVPSQPGPRRQ